jgi:hypothetical protein
MKKRQIIAFFTISILPCFDRTRNRNRLAAQPADRAKITKHGAAPAKLLPFSGRIGYNEAIPNDTGGTL